MMKKTIYVVWNDMYHHAQTYHSIAHKVFDNDKWDLHFTDYIRDVVQLDKKPDLVVNFTIGCGDPDNNDHLNTNEQQVLLDAVKNGMGMIYVHAGLAVIDPASPLFQVSLGHFASHPKEHNPVYVQALPGCTHPIVQGVEPFEAPDEHYFCQVDIAKAVPFLCSVSIAGTEIAGWCQELGLGRVCSITPGHTEEMLAKMEKLLDNAAGWCVHSI
jgi:type 1 glutamine amidotransferase